MAQWTSAKINPDRSEIPARLSTRLKEGGGFFSVKVLE